MKVQNSFTTKTNNQKNKENPFNIYNANKLNLKNKLSDKKNNKKTLASSSTSYQLKNRTSTLSNIKPINSLKETLNKAYSRLNAQLHSYNYSIDEINKQIINDIIYDEKKRIVSIFKDHLIYYEITDFFKQYYKKNKSVRMILRFINYYEAYTKFYPEYGPLEDVLKILKKNIKKKKKYYERFEEDEVNKYINNENKKKFERLIKESEIKTNNTNSKINNSGSTLILDSINKNQNKNIASNKDFYSILKEFIDYNDNDNDNIFDKEGVHTLNNFNINENHDNIFIINSKLNNYVKKTVDDDKFIGIKKDKNKFNEKTVRNKRYISILPCINILNDIINKIIRKKTKSEQRQKLIEYGKNYKTISLKKKFLNPLLKSINHSSKLNNHKYNDSKLLSKNTKSKIIKYKIKTHLINSKPYNTKKIFNSYNKYNSNSTGNNYTLSSYRYSTEWNKSRKSPESNRDNSPTYPKKNINNLIINSVKNKKRKNHILNFENYKKMNNINSLRFSNKNSNNSENNNKDLNNNINTNTNNICIKLKNNKFYSKSGNWINICKKNTIRKISPLKNIKNKSPNKKKNILTNKKKLSNPFKLEINHIILNNTINHNIIFNMNNIYTNNTEREYINNYNTIRYVDKNESKNKEKIIKKKNNLILIKSKMKNNKINSIKNKSNKSINKNNSLYKNKNKTILTLNNKFSNLHKYNIKNNNNILKTVIDKSSSKKELNIKLKKKANSIIKSCFSGINNKNDIKKTIVLEDLNNIDINKNNNIKKDNFSNADGNTLIKNKIIKHDINNNRNGNKKARICLKLPNNINTK